MSFETTKTNWCKTYFPSQSKSFVWGVYAYAMNLISSETDKNIYIHF
jgi:hypothetical protein